MRSAAEMDTVTPTNFQDTPQSRWGFCHVRELHRTANVWRGAGPAWDLPHAVEDLSDVVVGEKVRTLGAMLDEPHHHGLCVLHRGKLVFEAYRNGMRPHDTHILMSTTKSFAGSLAGILLAEGALDEDAAVTAILPELDGSAYEGATVRHVLDMRVGLDFSEDYLDPASDFARMDAACGWRPLIATGDPTNLADFFPTMRGKPPHGGSFHYVSPNAVVLGWMLEAVTDRPFADLLSERIWQPMAAACDADLVLDSQGRSQTEGGLNVTLTDLARFGELHRAGGARGGRQIVPEDFIADMRANGDTEAWSRGTMANEMPGHTYRSQWYVDRSHAHAPFFTAGAFGQSVWVDPVAEVTIAKLSCFPNEAEHLFGEMFQAFHAIAQALHGG